MISTTSGAPWAVGLLAALLAGHLVQRGLTVRFERGYQEWRERWH